MVEVAGRCSESQASGDDYGGVVGGAVGFTEGALFEYQLPLVCDQLSLTCEG